MEIKVRYCPADNISLKVYKGDSPGDILTPEKIYTVKDIEVYADHALVVLNEIENFKFDFLCLKGIDGSYYKFYNQKFQAYWTKSS